MQCHRKVCNQVRSDSRPCCDGPGGFVRCGTAHKRGGDVAHGMCTTDSLAIAAQAADCISVGPCRNSGSFGEGFVRQSSMVARFADDVVLEPQVEKLVACARRNNTLPLIQIEQMLDTKHSRSNTRTRTRTRTHAHAPPSVPAVLSYLPTVVFRARNCHLGHLHSRRSPPPARATPPMTCPCLAHPDRLHAPEAMRWPSRVWMVWIPWKQSGPK
jgi:hypothetical protein